MTPTPLERSILRGLIADQQAAANDIRTRMMSMREHDRIKPTAIGEIPLNPEKWLSRRLSPADRKAVTRAYETLQAAGLVVAMFGPSGRRVNRLQITEAGRKAAGR
jgi:hypothetical protein